ncbi:hypothetical protein SAMN04487895_112161 [Paenibacillus sophorae]|uniref:Uncharacterized protein n=1 Tax=Paenibacillus sophorae TaxID=1333845 RepID=A0A1H8SYH0_9BACL|nr:hypothetical protein SAMN04487895_112161 [Paenibacillus sophorae]
MIRCLYQRHFLMDKKRFGSNIREIRKHLLTTSALQRESFQEKIRIDYAKL